MNLMRVRLLINRDGGITITDHDILPLGSPYTLSLAKYPISSDEITLYHKTTDRSIYDRATPLNSTASDVLLWNERSEITETRIANIVVGLNGKLYTPPLESGLLPGCLRAELLQNGEIEERPILVSELQHADSIQAINSLRGMWQVVLL
jgi:para-aminobenzoate synthetase/4-amino-4-deoxychorismate lyase